MRSLRRSGLRWWRGPERSVGCTRSEGASGSTVRCRELCRIADVESAMLSPGHAALSFDMTADLEHQCLRDFCALLTRCLRDQVKGFIVEDRPPDTPWSAVTLCAWPCCDEQVS